MKIIRIFLIFAALFLFIPVMFSPLIPMAEGVIVQPRVDEYIKSDGRVVFISGFGDEFLSYATDSYGNLVTTGDDGELYFAKWAPESAFWDDASPLYYVLPTDRKPKGAPPGTRKPEYEDMHPLRNPIPEYMLKRANSLSDCRDRMWRSQYLPEPLPTILTVALPGCVKGENYSRTLRVYPDYALTQISWSLGGGSLPDGLSLSAAGEISGTPVSEGKYNFTVKVENASGSYTQDLSITVTLNPDDGQDKQDDYEPYEPQDDDPPIEDTPDNGGGGCNSATGTLMMLPALTLLFKRKN